MLEHGQVMEGLREKAKKFEKAYDAKDYLSAMWIYNEALNIAVFMELSEEDKQELFGDRQNVDEWKEEDEKGLFKESMVERARLWCIRNNKTRQEAVDTRYTRISTEKK